MTAPIHVLGDAHSATTCLSQDMISVPGGAAGAIDSPFFAAETDELPYSYRWLEGIVSLTGGISSIAGRSGRFMPSDVCLENCIPRNLCLPFGVASVELLSASESDHRGDDDSPAFVGNKGDRSSVLLLLRGGDDGECVPSRQSSMQSFRFSGRLILGSSLLPAKKVRLLENESRDGNPSGGESSTRRCDGIEGGGGGSKSPISDVEALDSPFRRLSAMLPYRLPSSHTCAVKNCMGIKKN